MHSEHLGYGRARDVRVEYRRFKPPLCRRRRKHRRNRRLAYAALAADDSYDLFYASVFRLLRQCTRRAVLAARRAVVIAFCHGFLLVFPLYTMSAPKARQLCKQFFNQTKSAAFLPRDFSYRCSLSLVCKDLRFVRIFPLETLILSAEMPVICRRCEDGAAQS